MARTYDYSQTADNVIQMALEDLGIIIAGGTVGATDSTYALLRLNVAVVEPHIPKG
mgnify:CR=1 FL=1